MGFDVTLIHSTKDLPSNLPDSETATFNTHELRLREGEKHKFARQSGGTNAISKRTLSADEVIGEILDSNYAFIPIAVGPFGDIGSLFMRFWDGSDTLPLPNFTKACPNALRAAKRATAGETPWDILGKADAQWKKQCGSSLFEGSYLSPTPSIWANQQLGLVCCTQLANHINTSFNHLRHCPGEVCDGWREEDDASVDGYDEPSWRWTDIDFGKIGDDNIKNPAVCNQSS